MFNLNKNINKAPITDDSSGKENKESYQEYLNNYLAQVKQAYSNWLLDYKKGLDSELNNFLVQKTKEAELKYEEDRKNIVNEFQKEMGDFEKRKASEPDPYGLLAKEEKFLRESFERQIKSNGNALRATIEMFKNKMQ